MKRLIVLIIFVCILWISSKASAAWRPEPHEEGSNFYKSCKNIDQKTYKTIKWSYGKDKNGIYYGCDKVPVKDKKTFTVMNFKWISEYAWYDKSNSYYASDKFYVYQWAVLLSQIDKKTFNFIDGPWFTKDKNHLLCRGDFQIFSWINGNKIIKKDNYISDNNKVFLILDWYCAYIDWVDSKSRKVIWSAAESIYSQDKNNIYFDDKAIIWADIATRNPIGSWYYYSQDKNNIYFQNVNIIWVDKSTFVINEKYNDYSSDKNNIYFMWKVLSWYLSSWYNIDRIDYWKDAIYYSNNPIKYIILY